MFPDLKGNHLLSNYNNKHYLAPNVIIFWVATSNRKLDIS